MLDEFSPEVLLRSQIWLDELLRKTEESLSNLSGNPKNTSNRGFVKPLETLQSLRDSHLDFGNPSNELVKLTPELLLEMGLTLSPAHKQKMTQRDFYYMTLTLNMRPRPGTEFDTIEYKLIFGPKGKKEPIIVNLFPDTEWQNVLNVGGSFNLALDANLEWVAEVDSDHASIGEIAGHLKTRITQKGSGSVFVTLPNFTFSFKKALITAEGKGSSECSWNISRSELKENLTIKSSLVFSVPKNTKKINLEGIALAKPSVRWLSADLRDVALFLGDKFQALLRGSSDDMLCVSSQKDWKDLELPNQ